MKKYIIFDNNAEKEIKYFPKIVQLKLVALLEILQEEGKLEKPFAKKLDDDLFEIRIK